MPNIVYIIFKYLSDHIEEIILIEFHHVDVR